MARQLEKRLDVMKYLKNWTVDLLRVLSIEVSYE